MSHRIFRLFLVMVLLIGLVAVENPLVAYAAPPGNDDIANAEVIASLPFSATVDITEATIETDENQFLCTDVQRSVWYVFTPESTMMLNINMQGGAVSSSLGGIYQIGGSGFNGLSTYRCAYSANPPVNVRLDAGHTYYIQVASYTEEVGTIQLNLEQLPAPANDNFADAISIDSLPFSMTTPLQAAVFENGEPQQCNFMDRSVWYSFTPDQNMLVQADLQGSDFFNTNVNVYRSVGTGITDLEFLTCSIFNVGIAVFSVEAGQKYYFQAGNAFGDIGTVTLNVKALAVPANDNFADATIIPSLPFQRNFEITGAGVEPDERQDCGTLAKTVWFQFTPSQDLSVRITTDGTMISNAVGVFHATSSGMAGLEFLTCATSIFEVNAGETYYIQAGTHTGWSGDIQLNLEQAFPPPNDLFAEATAIESVPFSATVDTTDAWFEPNEPNPCSTMVHTVWYSLTPTETMVLQVNTPNHIANGDNVNIYQGGSAGFADLAFMGCTRQGGFTLIAEAGQTYFLQAGSVNGVPGLIQFDVTPVFPPSNDEFADAEVITSLTTSRIVDLTAATQETNEPQACISMDRTAWYRLQPQTTTRVRFDTNGGIGANINIYRASGAGITDLQFLECTAFFLPTLQLEAGQIYYLQVGSLGGLGSAQINLTEIANISGRITDVETGLALPGNQPPFAVATLQRICGEGCIENISSVNADAEGRFTFDNYFGNPLPAGTYQIEAIASLYDHTIFGPFEFTGANLDVGDLAIAPTPTIGSISGRLIDAATSQPVSPTFTPVLSLFRCDTSGCLFVNGAIPDSKGRFRFETDQFGNPLPAGNYQVSANADQYHQQDVPIFSVGGDEHRSLGNIRIQSFPVRVSDLVLCPTIPSSGGTCEFSVRLTNGTNSRLRGAAWSFVEGGLPDTPVGYTNFQAQPPTTVDLNRGSSQVFHFEFTAPPSNNNLGQSMLCARLFAGIGDNPLFNTVAMRDLFCVIRETQGFAFVSPEDVMANTNAEAVTTATGSDVEPNNSCQAAQAMGTVSERFVVDGNLDSSVTPDVDFFRFSGTPGQAASVDLEGQSTGQGTLGDPFLGYFDSNCNLLALNDDSGSLNSHLEITVPDDGIFILGATVCCDSGFFGGGNGSYRLTITPVQSIGSISGQVIDAVAHKGLRGDIAPFAFIRLLQCGAFGCFDVNGQSADARGRFRFETDSGGAPLRTGDYMLIVSADQYQTRETERFSVGADQDLNVGNIALTSSPIRFTDMSACSVPSAGGWCEFSVKIANGLSTRLSGQAWSIVGGSGIGSFANITTFQTDLPLPVSLDPGRSTTIRFRFRMSGTVADGAFVCTSVFVGNGTHPYFNPVGQSNLFCFTKGSNGFTLMSPQETQIIVQQMQILAPPQLDAVINKQE